ncbi:mannose-6-phosphate isomerase, class I [Propionibacteriaceae bacterium Y2011]
MVQRLTGTVQNYAWGSTTAIPRLRGVAPDGLPQAEVWWGAHPKAPSHLDADGRTLADLVADDPTAVGTEAAERFGATLPYLLKVLAAEQPLSLQAHPSRAEAEAGFAREEAAGASRDAPDRNYRDDWPKPETLVAVVPTEVLYGFADPTVSARRLARLQVPSLTELLGPLTEPGGADGIATVFLGLCRLTEEDRAVVDEVVAAARAGRDDADDDHRELCRTALALAEHHPGDPGVIAGLLMNHLTLAPGEAIHVPAGLMHAYVRGGGVEIMANSDNVLRGGLTGKHVDVDELGRVVDFSPSASVPVTVTEEATGVFRYGGDTPEYRLWRLEVAGAPIRLPGDGTGRIVLVISGTVTVDGVEVPPVEAVWVSAAESAEVAGTGQVFVAGPGVG